MNGGINAAATCAKPAQSAMGRVQEDQSKAMDVMKDMVTGKVSASDGIKQLQSLVVDQAVAMGALPSSAAGFSSKDTFESGGAPRMLDLGGGAARPQDTSFLDKESGGGSKPGVVSN